MRMRPKCLFPSIYQYPQSILCAGSGRKLLYVNLLLLHSIIIKNTFFIPMNTYDSIQCSYSAHFIKTCSILSGLERFKLLAVFSFKAPFIGWYLLANTIHYNYKIVFTFSLKFRSLSGPSINHKNFQLIFTLYIRTYIVHNNVVPQPTPTKS